MNKAIRLSSSLQSPGFPNPLVVAGYVGLEVAGRTPGAASLRGIPGGGPAKKMNPPKEMASMFNSVQHCLTLFNSV